MLLLSPTARVKFVDVHISGSVVRAAITHVSQAMDTSMEPVLVCSCHATPVIKASDLKASHRAQPYSLPAVPYQGPIVRLKHTVSGHKPSKGPIGQHVGRAEQTSVAAKSTLAASSNCKLKPPFPAAAQSSVCAFGSLLFFVRRNNLSSAQLLPALQICVLDAIHLSLPAFSLEWAQGVTCATAVQV